jgi:enoyl-CoA hydratase/carnithine racemase
MTQGRGAADRETNVRAEVREGVGIITLDRPRKLNAMTVGMYADFNAATRRFERDDAVGAVMVASSGRAFCAGGDLDMVNAAKAGAVASESMDLEMLDPASLSKPVLCSVVGACVGEGVAMVLASDLAIAGVSARFMLPEVAIGVPTVDIPLLAAGRVNPIHMMDVILTGDWKDAAWAERVGLVNATAPDDAVWETTFDLARRIAAAPRPVAALVKSLVYASRLTADRALLRERGAAARRRILAEAHATQN